MNFEFKKIVRPLDLREYAPEMETEIQVWVNPPRSLLTEYFGFVEAARSVRSDLDTLNLPVDDPTMIQGKQVVTDLAKRLDEIGRAQMEIFARLWSQGADGTRWSAEEIERLVEQSVETDPALWYWLCRKTLEMITAHRAGQKKA